MRPRNLNHAAPPMEILFAVPFALFAGILREAWKLAGIHVSDGAEPSRAVDLPRDDSWLQDVERFDLLLAPHRRRGTARRMAGMPPPGFSADAPR